MSKVKWNIVAVDLISLIATFEFNGIEFREVTDPSGETIIIEFVMEREAYDEHGSYVGTEIFTGILEEYEKREFGLTGLPWQLFPKFVLPHLMEVGEINTPDETDAYYPPDDDFAYQELKHQLDYVVNSLLPAYYDKHGYWCCGNFREKINGGI